MLTLGLDIGSTSCKAVVLKDGRGILAEVVIPLGTGTAGAQQAFDGALSQAGVNFADVANTCVTGYGRFTFKDANEQKSELSCHAKGMHFIYPDVRTIIDIGGQDVKVLSLGASGSLANFVMNDKCAAGTGRFLDVMARVLDVKVEELGDLDAQAQEVVSISSTCTVFAESEVISKLSSNVRIPDLTAGIHASVAKRVAGLVFRAGLVEKVAMSGGVALNKGVVRALRRELKTDILVHPDCQLTGALGAALYAFADAPADKKPA